MARAPMYLEIKRRLLDEIEGGIFPAGAQLTPEVELARRFGVSRPTVRQAVLDLARTGIVSRRPGRGTVVLPRRLGFPVGRLMSFSEEFASSSVHPRSKVISLELLAADETLAARLDVKVGERVFRLERTRLVDGRPVAWQRSQISHRLVPQIEAIDFEGTSLYAVLRDRYRLDIARGDEVVRAGTADAVDAERLDVSPGSAVFLIERRVFNQAGTLIELVDSVYRADSYEIRLALAV